MPIDRDRDSLQLFQWLRDEGYIPFGEDPHDRSTCSYTFLDGCLGGVAYVPDQQEAIDKFWTLYLNDIENEHKMYVNERVSMHSVKVFPLFFDLDFDNEILPQAKMVQVCRYVQEEVKRYYRSMTAEGVLQLMRMIICYVPPPPVQELVEAIASDTDSVSDVTDTETSSSSSVSVLKQKAPKTGIHLIFPDLIVTQQTAFLIQEGVRCKLERKLGSRPVGCKGWEDVIDARVYIAPCLRVLYSSKADKCPSCKGAGSEKGTTRPCRTCKGAKKVNGGREYYFYNCYDGNGEQDSRLKAQYVTHKVQLLKDVSIRRVIGTTATPGFEMYRGAPQFVPFTAESINTGQRQFSEDKRGSCRVKKFREVDRHTQGWKLVEEEVRNSNSMYSDICIKDIYMKRLTRGDMWIVTTTGHGSSSCQNLIGRDHNNNTIYFTITLKGLQQRCWCRCETMENRQSGKCKDYASQAQPISAELMTILFPGEKSQQMHAGISLEGKLCHQSQLEHLFGIHCKNVIAMESQDGDEEDIKKRVQKIQIENEKCMQAYIRQNILNHAKESDIHPKELAKISSRIQREDRLRKRKAKELEE